MSDGRVKSIVERVQRLQEEKRSIEDDIKEVYAEARSEGYDVKVLRAVVKHLGKDQDEVAEFDALFDLYLQAATSSHGAPRATHAIATGVPTTNAPSGGDTGSAVEAGAPVSKIATPESLPAAQSEAAAGSRPEQGSAARAAGSGEVHSAHADQFVTSSGEGEGARIPVDPSPAADDLPAIGGLAAANAIAARAAASVAATPRPQVRDEGMPDIPAFLRRPRAEPAPSFGDQA